MTPLRVLLLLAAGAACVAVVLLPEPDVFAPLAACGLVLFVVGAGSIAADAFPWRPLHFWCSLFTVPAGMLLLSGGLSVVPHVASALVALALQLAPPAVAKLRS